MNIKEERNRLNIKEFNCREERMKCIEHYTELYGNETHSIISKCVYAGLIEPCTHVTEIIKIIDNEIIKTLKFKGGSIEHYWNKYLTELVQIFNHKILLNVQNDTVSIREQYYQNKIENMPTDPILDNQKHWHAEFEKNKGDNHRKWYPEEIKERFTEKPRTAKAEINKEVTKSDTQGIIKFGV